MIQPTSTRTILTPTREDFADELRGIALLGIVLVNAPFLGISWQGFTQASVSNWFDQWVAFAIVAFAQAKFYLLFAFLFGYSSNFILKNAKPEGKVRYLRRLSVLAVFGLLHALFFFVGDILIAYAVIGLNILWLCKRSERFVLKFAVVVLALWSLLLGGVVLLAWLDPAAMMQSSVQTAQIDAVFANGSFLQIVAVRWSIWPKMQTMIFTLNGLSVLAMFCFGWVAGRRHLLADPQGHRELWLKGSVIGWAVGLPIALAAAWLSVGVGTKLDQPGPRETLGVVLGFFGAPLLTLGYVSWLALLKSRCSNVLSWFRRSGRMSLTGYIGESALLSLIFCGYGLGFFGQLGAAKVACIAILVWFALDIFAILWQRQFGQGPLERLLKVWVK
jgi:uncharacterized protein